MRGPLSRYLWDSSAFLRGSTVIPASQQFSAQSTRCFSQTAQSMDIERPGDQAPKSTRDGVSLNSLSSLLQQNQNDRLNKRATNRANRFMLDTSRISSDGTVILDSDVSFEEPHHFHVFATRHNTHITFTKPNRDPLISVSAGNIGFRKSGRKHYDSAFQLASYVMGRIQEQGLNAQIKQLEVTLRGFGAGREAVTKALLGTEGRLLRQKVIKVTDATRLKFGGTRSKKPRRLG